MYDRPYEDKTVTDVHYYVQHVPPPQPKKGFSKEEIKNLAVAVGVMTVAFTLAFSDAALTGFSNQGVILVFFLVTLVAVVPGFVLHELAHKFMAQKYNCWAEFRYSKQGLFIALITSLMGFVFAAPGAVYIRGNITTEQNGKISVAGPLTNLGVVGIFMVPFFLLPVGSIGWFFGFMGVRINLILAGFNLLPFGPLDGRKVKEWNPGVLVGMFAVTIGLYVGMFML